ncbi:PilW family protein [Cupriavidus plantarum]|uniref:Type IV pilus-assembly PilW-like protein n=1 Tax=Cupriavidus plantarum TaxID=942865 RepID=A0A316EUX3_9BURK|nr:PilW family protein [Cupriavidus plantarum]PWK35395.1 type IV pilus-assembly PilW-like protein [Cupriavidus plantarum]
MRRVSCAMTGACRHTAMPTQRRARGHSLISLLVGMTVGLVVMGVLFGIFVSMKTSFREQSRLTRLASAETRLMDRLSQVVQTAGFYPYREYNGVPRGGFEGGAGWQPRQVIAGENGTGAAGNILRTRFRIQRGETVRDCGGDRPPAADTPATYLQTVSVSAAGVLECVVESADGTHRQTYALAESILRFAVTYGVDQDADGGVDRYLDAAAVTAAASWDAVATVRFDLALAKGLPQGTSPEALTQVIRVAYRD